MNTELFCNWLSQQGVLALKILNWFTCDVTRPAVTEHVRNKFSLPKSVCSSLTFYFIMDYQVNICWLCNGSVPLWICSWGSSVYLRIILRAILNWMTMSVLKWKVEFLCFFVNFGVSFFQVTVSRRPRIDASRKSSKPLFCWEFSSWDSELA